MEYEKIKVSLNSMDKIREFVNVTNSYKSDIDIMTERAVVDAKSIIGICALDLTEGIYVKIISDTEEEYKKFKKEMEGFK